MQACSALVIDDDSTVRELVSDVLKKLAAHVVTAVNGENALAVLQNIDKPDLIVVDLIMPRMDGVQFVQRLREIKLFEDVPVILMTANRDPEFLLEASDLHLAGLLLKPVDASKLTEKAQRIFSLVKR